MNLIIATTNNKGRKYLNIKNIASTTAMNIISIGFIENLSCSNTINSLKKEKAKATKEIQNKENFKIALV